MTAPIRHRGPDDDGTWVDAAAGIGLGFRRLAIVDLSEQGHQPMASASGRFTIAFNGEVYNHHAVRAELGDAGARFRGHSDTEVILAAFERWGIARSLDRFVGMFAIAVWDSRERTLTLARDRMGKKPLFVYAEPGLVSFASELKALHAGPSFQSTIDRDALATYLQLLYVPGPQSIFERVRKLEPGHLLEVRDADAPLPDAQPFWSLDDAVARGTSDPFRGTDDQAVDALDGLLGEAVRQRMQADVPLGAFLSGGIDSSVVVGVMQANAMQPVRTFSISFDVAEHDEAAHAAAVARHLGTDHTELAVTGRDALEVVPKLADIYDEPMADASQIPTYLVSSLARRSVTVALSGDGGDELFGGYNRYTHGEQIIERVGRLPSAARRLIGAGIGSMDTEGWNRVYRAVSPVMPRRYRQRLPGEKLRKIGRLMGPDTLAGRYGALVSQWAPAHELVRGARPLAVVGAAGLGSLPGRSLAERMMFADQCGYLVDDQMAKVDRASMAASLEVRVPLLDHRIVEFSWRLPAHMKVRSGEGKWILRRVLDRYVPRPLIDRPKMGFSVPISAWLRGPLRGWAEELLSPERLRADGVLDEEPVLRAWQQLQRGDDAGALGLWAVLLFQQWRARWVG